MRHAFPLLALLLAACQPQAPDGSPAQPPADAPAMSATVKPGDSGDLVTPAAPDADLIGDVDARGTEPFWAVNVRKDGVRLIRPDPEPAVVGAYVAPKVDQAGRTVFATRSDDREMVLMLRRKPCSDGMSDLVYPFEAEFRLGDQAFEGCGGKPADMPKEGEAKAP